MSDTYLEISILMCFVIVFVLLFFVVMKDGHKLIRTRKCIWLLIAFRLLIPISLMNVQRPCSIQLVMPKYSVGVNTYRNLLTFHKTPNSDKYNDDVSELNNYRTVNPQVDLFSTIWITGVLILLFYYVLLYVATSRFLRKNSCIPEQLKTVRIFDEEVAKLSFLKKPRIKIVKNISISPCTYGVLHPTVFLPENDFEAEDLQLIIRHELVHIKNNDLLYKVICLLANTIHWFNPMVWLMRFIAERDLEIICDAGVLQGDMNGDPMQYSEVIMSCLEMNKKGTSYLSTGYVGNTKFLKKRFSYIFEDYIIQKVSIVCIVLIAFVCVISEAMITPSFKNYSLPWKKVRLQEGIQINDDFDGDGIRDVVTTQDYYWAGDYYTDVAFELGNGNVLEEKFENYFYSSLYSGDFDGDEIPEIVSLRNYAIDSIGGGEATVMKIVDGQIVNLTKDILPNPDIEMEQPKDFGEVGWVRYPVTVVDVKVIRTIDKDILRMVILSSECSTMNPAAVCMELSYTGSAWYMERMKDAPEFYDEGCDIKDILFE